MKRIFSLFLVLTMAFSLCACSVNKLDGTQPSTETQDGTESQIQNNTTAPTSTVTEPADNENVIQIPTKEIYFSCPSGWEVEEETKTLILMESEDALIGIFYDWQNTATGELIEMVSNYSAKFLRDISSYSKGYLRTSSIEVLSSGNGKIGEFECATFTGKANNDGEWDCHMYGYTAVIDGVNVMVIGLVSAKAQDASMIAEIDALTDQVANSVRTHK